MNYYQYSFKTDPESTEILIAALCSDDVFESYMETDTGFEAYIGEPHLSPKVEHNLTNLAQTWTFIVERTFVPAVNWNKEWESNFPPMQVDDFVGVRAEFHPPFQGVRHEIVMQPKMAFGTGHHETTYMMMATMRDIQFKGANVFDYGCGTGILAILAAYLGASQLEAIDIEEESRASCEENSARNGVPHIIARQGDITAVKGNNFDIILANINRNVILSSASTLSALTAPGGLLLSSGYLTQDEAAITETLSQNGFTLIGKRQFNNWICLLMKYE